MLAVEWDLPRACPRGCGLELMAHVLCLSPASTFPLVQVSTGGAKKGSEDEYTLSKLDMHLSGSLDSRLGLILYHGLIPDIFNIPKEFFQCSNFPSHKYKSNEPIDSTCCQAQRAYEHENETDEIARTPPHCYQTSDRYTKFNEEVPYTESTLLPLTIHILVYHFENGIIYLQRKMLVLRYRPWRLVRCSLNGNLNREMVAQRDFQMWMAFDHADFGLCHLPVFGLATKENIIQPFGSGIFSIQGNLDRLSALQPLALLRRPSPCVQNTVTSSAVFLQVV